MKISPYYDATMAACNRFRSNLNFLFISVFLGSIYLFIVIRFLTGQFVNQLLSWTLPSIKNLKLAVNGVK